MNFVIPTKVVPAVSGALNFLLTHNLILTFDEPRMYNPVSCALFRGAGGSAAAAVLLPCALHVLNFRQWNKNEKDNRQPPALARTADRKPRSIASSHLLFQIKDKIAMTEIPR